MSKQAHNDAVEDDIVPIEIKLMSDKKYVPLYLNILESGFEEKRDIRIVIVGKKGSGKTSLVKRLFGIDKSEILEVTSTNGIEIHRIRCNANTDEGIWNKLDVNTKETDLYERLLIPFDKTLKSQGEGDTDRAVQARGPRTPSVATKPLVTSRIVYGGDDDDDVDDDYDANVDQDSHLVLYDLQPNLSIEQTYREIQTMTSKVNSYHKEEYATLLLWDFAGDEIFYHTHQTFLSPDSIYLVVAKLNEAHDKEAQDLFKLWMDSIHCFSRLEDDKHISDDSKTTPDDIDPPVVIVGTWRDAVTSESGKIKTSCKENILKYTKNMTEDERRHVRHDVFISNTTDDDSVFQPIRQYILSLARQMRTWNTKYPLKFIQLEKSLQERKKELPIITFQELKQISTKTTKPLNDEELILFLKFHHGIRALVFFEDLPDYIILDTQWLSDAFKSIVTAKDFRSVSIKNFKRWNDFHSKGQLHRVVLEDLFNEKENILFKNNKDHILNIMEKFDIIIRPTKSDRHSADENACYYVPCMIKEKPKCDIYKLFNVTDYNCKKSTWFCFKFRFLPPNLMNHLIASLCLKYEIAEVGVTKQVIGQKTEQAERVIALFKGIAVFELQIATKRSKLLVTSHSNLIQIQILEFGEVPFIKRGMYRHITDFLTDEINKIIGTRFRMNNLSFEKRWACENAKPEFVTGANSFSEVQITEYYCDKCTATHMFNGEWLDVMVPSEMKLMADKRSIDLYLKLLESGSEKKRDIRLVVVGKKGAGKTSLIRRLFGEDITDVTSTNGIEIHKIKCKAMSDDGIWNKLDGKNAESEIDARILKQMEKKLICKDDTSDEARVRESSTPRQHELDKETTSPQVKLTVHIQQPNKVFEQAEKDIKPMLKSAFDSTVSIQQPNKVYEQEERDTTMLNFEFKSTVPTQQSSLDTKTTLKSELESIIPILQSNVVLEQAKRNIKTMLKSEIDFDDEEEYATLLLWDFAGDEEFYHTHQTFLSPNAIYLVVTKLNEADDKNAKEMFQLWMNSIHCYCRLDDQKNKSASNIADSDEGMKKKKYLDPPVVFVGSHKDQVTPSAGEELVIACKKCVDRYVKEVPKDALQHIQDEHFVSNTDDKDIIFQKIRQTILSLARKMRIWNTDYPLKFIQLEKLLQEKMKELPIISFRELSRITTKTLKPLNKKELILFLKFHHEIRTLVYFEDLPDYIILDTQWLSDAFKCIITTKKFHLNVIRHQFPCEWDDFDMKGTLHRVVLDQILKTYPKIFKFDEKTNSYKYKDHIVGVMEKFDIIISPNIPDKDADDGKPPFYVPCMIKTEPDGDIYKMFHVSETCKKSTWLCFKFTFLPPHLKNHLIASLSRKYEIAEVPVCEPNKRPIALFKGTAVFKLQETTKLLIMFSADHIQIQVWEFGNYNNIDKFYYKNIAEFVTVEINGIISRRFKMTTVIFDQKLECCLQTPECVKGSCVWLDKTSNYFCDICTKRHDNEWSEHQPVQKQNLEPIGSESVTYSLEDDTKQYKIDFNDILDEMMTRLVISVDDRRCIELNVSQETMEQQLLEIVNKRGEPNKTVCIDVLKQNSGYEDLTTELKKTLSVTSPTDNRELQDVPDYKVRLQKNYLHIINTIKHDNQ